MTFAHVAPARSSSAAMGRRRKRRTELLHRGSLDNCHLCGRFNFLTIRQIDRTYVSRLERGLENPTVAVLERLAEALGAQIVEFFAIPRRGEAPPQPLRGGRRPKG